MKLIYKRGATAARLYMWRIIGTYVIWQHYMALRAAMMEILFENNRKTQVPNMTKAHGAQASTAACWVRVMTGRTGVKCARQNPEQPHRDCLRHGPRRSFR